MSRKLKEKLTSMIGNESLGKAQSKVESKPKASRKEAKTPATKKIQSIEEEAIPFKMQPEIRNNESLAGIEREVTQDLANIYDIIGVPMSRPVRNQITPEAIQTVEFTPTEPIGLDVDEVENFCDIIEDGIRDYMEVLEAREDDIVKLVKEIARLQAQMIAQSQKTELDKLLQDDTEVEKLREQNTELTIEREELLQQINILSKSRGGSVSHLETELNQLRQRNDFLTQRNAELNHMLSEYADIIVDEPIEPLQTKQPLPSLKKEKKSLKKAGMPKLTQVGETPKPKEEKTSFTNLLKELED